MPAFPVSKPVVFPLFGIVGGKCACGNVECSRVGKHPRVAWGEIEYGHDVPRPEPGAGVGLKTGAHPRGSDVFVVDLDGDGAAELWEALGGNYTTCTVLTPRGFHLYFRHPGFHVKNSAGELGGGIDIRGDGGFVVAPGSPHRSGGTYTIGDDEIVEDAPEWLLEWLISRSSPAEINHYSGDVTEPNELHRRRELYAEYLRTEAPARGPALRGQGDQILFEVVQRGAYDLALPVEDVLELVAEHYDPRCDPRWGDELEERVCHKANDAKTSSTRPRAEPLPADLVHLLGVSTTTGQPNFLDEKASRAAPSELGERWGGWDQPVPPTVYLLEGLIPENKVVTFFAEGGSVKSWAAFALAISVATGEPWLGKAVQQGRALILDYEDGEHEFQRRMRILRGGVLEDIPNLGYKYSAPQINRIELWKILARMNLRLLVIDTLGSGMPATADENTTAFAEAVKLAGLFTEVKCTVVIVAHANKTGGLRGSSAIRDSSDVAFRFEPVSETDTIKRMRMICDKPGPQIRPKPVNLELSNAGLSTFTDEAADAGRNVRGPEDLRAAILLVLDDRPMTTEALHAHFKGTVGEKIVDSTMRELVQLGKIVKPGYHAQWQLDDDAQRLARVLQVAPTCHSSAELAREAYVPTECVRAALKARKITLRTGKDGGGFI